MLLLALWGIWGSGRSDQSFCPNADIFFASLSPFFRAAGKWDRITHCHRTVVTRVSFAREANGDRHAKHAK